MPTFIVTCYERGVRDAKGNRMIEADTKLEAAETVCGGQLVAAGTLGRLRAEVWDAGTAKAGRELFYRL